MDFPFAGSRMLRGFVYLIASVDWFSRRVLAWRRSITLETDFCIEAMVLRRPVESAQFASMAFASVLRREKIAISVDGRGAWRDNVFVERLWRSVTRRAAKPAHRLAGI